MNDKEKATTILNMIADSKGLPRDPESRYRLICSALEAQALHSLCFAGRTSGGVYFLRPRLALDVLEIVTPWETVRKGS